MNKVGELKSSTFESLEQSEKVQVEGKEENEKHLKCPCLTLPPVKLLKESSKKCAAVATTGRLELGSLSWLTVVGSENSVKAYSRWSTSTKMEPAETPMLGIKAKSKRTKSDPRSDHKSGKTVMEETGRKHRRELWLTGKNLCPMMVAKLKQEMKWSNIPSRVMMMSMALPALTRTHSLPRRQMRFRHIMKLLRKTPYVSSERGLDDLTSHLHC